MYILEALVVNLFMFVCVCVCVCVCARVHGVRGMGLFIYWTWGGVSSLLSFFLRFIYLLYVSTL
jgi:hypothetical protein